MALGLASPGSARHTANLRSSSPFLRSCTRCARPDGGGRRLAQARGWAGNRGPRYETLGDDDIVGWNWTGSDEFTPLNDRRDEPPLPLPRLSSSRRIVLVRHGQSTWNARNRIQGSSDFSVLTDLGVEQATVTQKRLAGMDFQCMFYSPLKRAAQTSEIVWGGRSAPAVKLPSLREIDLYSFQGLDKVDRRVLYAQEYKAWQGTPAEFLIDGHAPVRELWYRASLAWQHILLSELQPQCSLVVAHNAVNQALLCTALGLPPPFFRRFAQTNGAFTVLDFKYSGPEGSQRVPVQPTVQVERMNQFPSRPLNPSKTGKSTPKRLVLICGEAASPAVQAALTLLASNGADVPPLLGIGSTAQQVLDISTAVQAALSTPGEGRVVTAVACAEACQLLLGACLGAVVPGVGQEQGTTARDAGEVGRLFHMTEGGITIVNWMPGQHEMSAGIVLCVNYLDTGGSSRSTKEAVADARARDAQATTNAAA